MSENNQVVEYTTTVDESVIGLPKFVWCMAWLAWCGFFAGIDFMKQWWLGVAAQTVYHAFQLARERCELGKLRIGNAYNYAAGIVGNLMREAMDNARAWTETAIRQKDAHDHAD